MNKGVGPKEMKKMMVTFEGLNRRYNQRFNKSLGIEGYFFTGQVVGEGVHVWTMNNTNYSNSRADISIRIGPIYDFEKREVVGLNGECFTGGLYLPKEMFEGFARLDFRLSLEYVLAKLDRRLFPRGREKEK